MPSWSLHPYDEWPIVNTIPAHLSHFAADTLTSLFIFYMWSYQNLYFSNNSLCNPAFPNDLFKIPPRSHSAFPIHFSTFFQCGTVVILYNNVYGLSHLECGFIRAFYVHCCSTSALYMLTTWLFLRNISNRQGSSKSRIRYKHSGSGASKLSKSLSLLFYISISVYPHENFFHMHQTSLRQWSLNHPLETEIAPNRQVLSASASLPVP